MDTRENGGYYGILFIVAITIVLELMGINVIRLVIGILFWLMHKAMFIGLLLLGAYAISKLSD